MKKYIEKNKSRILVSEGHLGGYIYGRDKRTWFSEIWELIVERKRREFRKMFNLSKHLYRTISSDI